MASHSPDNSKDMAGKIIWLMCYISLGLALTLGNRPGSHYAHTQIRSSGHDHRLRNVDQSIVDTNINKKYSSESDSSSRFDEEPYDLPPDWSLYDDRHFTRDFIDNRLNDNSRDYINNNNNKGLVNKPTTSVMDNTDTHRELKSKERHSNHGSSDSNNNNKGGLRDSDEMSSGHSRSSGSGSGNSGSIRNQYDLNGRSMGRRDNLVEGRSSSLKSSSSVWSLEPNVVVDYPWKIQQANGGMRLPAGNTYARTLGKRNQVAGGRRKPVESRSTSQQGQPPPFLGSSIPEVAMGSMASQLMLRTARGNRQYDVPQIGKFLLSLYICTFIFTLSISYWSWFVEKIHFKVASKLLMRWFFNFMLGKFLFFKQKKIKLLFGCFIQDICGFINEI